MTTLAAVAGLSIVDIAIVGLLGLGLIIGFIKGFTTSFERGCIGKFIVLGLAAFCAFVLAFGIGSLKPALEGVEQYNSLTASISQKVIPEGSAMNNPARVEDGKILVTVDGEDKSFSAVVVGSEVAAVDDAVGKLVKAETLAEYGTVGAYLGKLLGRAVGFLAVFIVMTIVFTIANLILCKLFRKSQEPDENGKSPLRVADRIVGSVAMTIMFGIFTAIIMGVLYFVDASGKVPAVSEQISNSTIGKLIFELFAKLFA